MLRPPDRPHRSQSRSPQIRPIGDDHPLSILATDADQDLGYIQPRQSSLSAPTSSWLDRSSHDKESLSPGWKSLAPGTTEVYVHRVNKTDTLPKIILQYRISASVLRRANRMFANDSIQFRDTLLLPVEACTVIVHEIEDNVTPLIETADLVMASSYFNPQLGSSSMSSKSTTRDGPATTSDRSQPTTSSLKRVSKSPIQELDVARQVLIENIGTVDVARVPAASLSYFPPRKNKQGHSDLARTSMDKSRDSIDIATPERGSFENMRIGAGKVAAEAYNGAQGLIRRMKERKNTSEIDLIEL